MKSLINYYVSIAAPISTLIFLSADKLISNYAFAWLLIVYALIYHPLISGMRLIATNKISNEKLLLCFIPGWTMKYFSFLFFNSEA